MKAAYKAFISLVVLVATIACMFLFAVKYNAIFWVNLAFAIVAIIMASLVILGIAAGNKKMFGLNVTAYAIAYVVADLGYAFKTLFAPSLLAKKVALVHVVLLAVFLIVIVLSR